MAQIIQFPGSGAKASNGYENLARLIALAETAKTLNFYMESIGVLEEQGNLLAGEAEKLAEQGRAKRIDMARPLPMDPVQADAPGMYNYTPEMGQAKPICQMEAHRAYYGKHWFIDTPAEIKGRGITFMKKYSERDFCSKDDHRIGWNEYRVTNNAFDKLKTQYSISQECCLD